MDVYWHRLTAVTVCVAVTCVGCGLADKVEINSRIIHCHTFMQLL